MTAVAVAAVNRLTARWGRDFGAADPTAFSAAAVWPLLALFAGSRRRCRPGAA